jgi:hypothetical protein
MGSMYHCLQQACCVTYAALALTCVKYRALAGRLLQYQLVGALRRNGALVPQAAVAVGVSGLGVQCAAGSRRLDAWGSDSCRRWLIVILSLQPQS